jgi:predicted NBD/HSP70 family sugar kinase
LNLGQNKFIGAVLNLRGEIKATAEVDVPGTDGAKALQLVYRILDQLMKKKLKPIVGIGVGTPGLINTREGIVLNAVNLEWQDLPLGRLLEARYKVPVTILNDSQATAIGEYVYDGGHQPESNLVVVNVRQGIGAGILINGQLFQGDGGGAGEIGHVVVQQNGTLCRCGKRGCLETLASSSAVLRRLKMDSLGKVESAFQTGDSKVRQVVLEAGRYLGTSLAGLIGTLNIQKIVLTGDMIRFGEPWLESVRTAMQAAALTRMAESTEVEIGKLDYRGCILGASAMLLLNGYSLLFAGAEDH